MDRKRLLDTVEVARRVRSGNVKWGDAAILAEQVLWLASHFLYASDRHSAAAPDEPLENVRPEALIAEIHDLRGALIHSSRKVEMLEQLLSLWQGTRL